MGLSGVERQALASALRNQSAADSIADVLDAVDELSTTEIAYVDGVTAGTAAAGKAVVLGSSKEIATITTATITTGNIATVNATNIDAGASGTAGTVDIFPAGGSKGKLAISCTNQTGDTTVGFVAGAMGQATVVTVPDPGASTADVVLTAGTQTIGGSKTFSSQIKSSANVGAAAATGNVATEYGDGTVHQTVLTLTNVAVTLADEAGVIAYGGTKLYDFPVGGILILGVVSDLDVTKSSAGVNLDWDGDFSLGTVTAANDADLTSTEADILTKTATPQAAAGATTANAASGTAAFLDGTGTAKDLFINFLVDDADHDVTGTACNLILNGTLKVTWIALGDY